ncbi:MAG: Hpt domain-containing protein [Lachnospiraceae bacterium]
MNLEQIQEKIKNDTRLNGIPLDAVQAFPYTEDTNLYLKNVTDFYDTIEERGELIESMEQKEDIKNYTIQVHSLKSSAKLIGATELSVMAAQLEQFGQEENWKKIHAHTPQILDVYRGYLSTLAPYILKEKEIDDYRTISGEEFDDKLVTLKKALEDYDLDLAEEICEDFRHVFMSPSQRSKMNPIVEAIKKVEYEAGKELIEQMQQELTKKTRV